MERECEKYERAIASLDFSKGDLTDSTEEENEEEKEETRSTETTRT